MRLITVACLLQNYNEKARLGGCVGSFAVPRH